jgi:hypothetical protein
VTAEALLLRRAYEAFNARDVEAVVALMHQVVRSPAGEVPSDGEVVHVCALRGGRVARMDVEPA